MKDEYVPQTSDDNMAPTEIIDLTSCKCKTNCQRGYCRCFAINVECTDFCGCTDICENTDPSTPTSYKSIWRLRNRQFIFFIYIFFINYFLHVQ